MGASGYAGGELLRLLCGHPTLSVGPLFGASSAGRRISETHRHLPTLAGRMIEPIESGLWSGALAEADVVFLALPQGHSGAVAAQISQERGPVVIDLGADHRLADPDAWVTYYGSDTPYTGEWTYGLPELPGARALIAKSRQIANPGCYPTGVALGMAPLLVDGLAVPRDVVVVAASGTSGAGRSASATMLGSEVMGSLSAYKVGGSHQHTPEMAQTLSRAAGTPLPVSFTPVLAPMPRGILATTSAPCASGVTTDDVRQCLLDNYQHELFVRVLDDDQWPRTADVLGSNSVHLQVAVDTVAERVVVVSAIDNLVKGAAGQAVQNANIVLGLDEGAGLVAEGVAP
ncbi:MAG: N-acetyl-gamma-glutamyl-phosphate reductase [Actinomycetia bacterium]|nr:N-acetyl-gamma-glutamyl-phosphate reductase [Actinomycetes bacterium]